MTPSQFSQIIAAATAGPWSSTGRDIIPEKWMTEGKVYGPRPFVCSTERFAESANNPDMKFIAISCNLAEPLMDLWVAAKEIGHENGCDGMTFYGPAKLGTCDCRLGAALAALDAVSAVGGIGAEGEGK